MRKFIILGLLLFANIANAQLFKHPFKSAKTDGGDATLVRPSDWNAFQLPAPDTSTFISEEFCGGATPGAAITNMFELGWAAGNSGTGTTVAWAISEAGHPCACSLTTGTTATRAQRIQLGSTVTNAGLITPSDFFDVTFIIRSQPNDANQLVRVGLGLNFGSNDQPTDGIYFEKLGADNNWFGVTRSASSQTRTAAMDATSTSWFRFRIRRVNGTTVGFTIGNGTEVTATATIPTVAIGPGAIVSNNGNASAHTLKIDYFHLIVTTLAR